MKKSILIITLLTVCFNLIASPAIIVPHRIYLDAGNRSGHIQIINTQQVKTAFAISLADRVQNETGGTNPIDAEENEHSASNLILFSPKRTIALEPNRKKPVRVKLKNFGALPEGEYRTYMKIVTDIPTEMRQQGYNVNVRTGSQLPIVVRKGKLTATATFSEMSVKDNTLYYTLNRNGNRSIFGNIAVLNKGEVIGESNDLGVYTEVDKVTSSIKLTSEPTGQIDITFTEDERSGSVKATYTISL